MVLAYVTGGGTVSHVTALGHFVAWYKTEPNDDGTYTPEVLVADARLDAPHNYGSYDYADEFTRAQGIPGITDLVLTSTGAIAWIGQRPAPDPALEVHYADYLSAGYQQSPLLLDTAPDVIPGSLAVGTHDVYWQRSDGPHVAQRAVM